MQSESVSLCLANTIQYSSEINSMYRKSYGVRQVIIREVPKTRAFETRFQISHSECECAAMISAV
jgi:hypothetical protein